MLWAGNESRRPRSKSPAWRWAARPRASGSWRCASTSPSPSTTTRRSSAASNAGRCPRAQAMTMAVNRDRINHELLGDSTVFDIDSPLAVGWMGCQVEPWTYDPEGAKAMLDEAGWRDEDGDGVREAHGVPNVDDGTKFSLSMNGYTGFDTLDLVELAVQEDLKSGRGRGQHREPGIRRHLRHLGRCLAAQARRLRHPDLRCRHRRRAGRGHLQSLPSQPGAFRREPRRRELLPLGA